MEFDDVVVKENPGLCRCCLSEGCYKDLGSEYSWMNETEVYADMLLECFDISISQHMDGPNGPNRLICEVCITRLRDACNFKKQVLESEKKFIDLVARGDFRSKVIFEPLMKAEVIAEAPAEEEVEYLDDDLDFDDNDDVPLRPPVDAVPGASGSEDITVSSLKVVRPKRGRPKKLSTSPEKPERKSKVAKLEEKARSSKTVRDLTGSVVESGQAFRTRSNLITLVNYTTIKPFKWQGQYLCYLCDFFTKAYSRLQRHYTEHVYYDFSDESILEHEEVPVKLDVSRIACELCDKNFYSVDSVIFHLAAKHNVQYYTDVKMNLEMYSLHDLKCLMCGLTYTYFQTLVTHLKNQHETVTFKPEHYGKSLKVLGTLNVETEKIEFKCSVCKSQFKDIRSLKKHKIFKHEDSTDGFKILPKKKNVDKKYANEDSAEGSKTIPMKNNVDTKDAKECNVVLIRKKKIKTDLEKPQPKPIDCIIANEHTTTLSVKNNIRTMLKMTTAIPFKYYMNQFMCFYCPQMFREHDDVLTHVNTHDVATSLKTVHFASGKFTTVKVDISALSCRLCNESFDDLDSIADHIVSVHNANYKKEIENVLHPYKLARDEHICMFCKTTFKYFQLLLKHVTNEHLTKNLICAHCEMKFPTRASLALHINVVHKVKGFKCNICSEVLPSFHKLKSHKSLVHKNEFPCRKCDEKFSSAYRAERHMMIVHNVGYLCQECGQAFVRKSFMVNHHRRVHMKEKEIPCKFCNRKFFNTALLRLHLVKHTRERHHTCDTCGKSFLWKRNLKQHMRKCAVPDVGTVATTPDSK